MKLDTLTALQSAYVQTQLEQTGIHYALVDGAIEVLDATPAQRLYVEGVVATVVAMEMMTIDQLAKAALQQKAN